MQWQLIESDTELAAILQRASGAPAVAVDTEFMRRNTFFPQIALLQLCFDDTAWLIDPLAIEDLGPLQALMTDPGVTKVLHSASEDLEVFQCWLGVLPAPLFDTQRAAALLNRGFGIGYRALVADMCGVDVPKGETRSDWLQRPLTESQCEYAAQDVEHLLPIWRTLDAACDEQGKRQWVLGDGEQAALGLATAAGDYYRRIKSGWKLQPRQLAALIAVSDWRELVARQRDKPRSWIIDDKACLTLAQGCPADAAQLAALDLPQQAQRRYSQQWLELLASVAAIPAAQLPARLPGPLDAGQRDGLKKLRQAGRDIATRLDIAPEVLLPAKDYELLLRQAGDESLTSPALWRGWRQEQVVVPLQQTLAERKA